MKILIIEAEEDLSDKWVSYFKKQSYLPETASDLSTAFYRLQNETYGCIIVDMNIRGAGELLKELKARHIGDTAVAIFSKKNPASERQRISSTVSEYLIKPFDLSELNTRVAAVIRSKSPDNNTLVHFNEIMLDTWKKLATVNDKRLDLTSKEFELLLFFINNKKRVISKNAIAESMRGNDMTGKKDFIYTYIKNLRKKLAAANVSDHIKSVYGMGYKFSD